MAMAYYKQNLFKGSAGSGVVTGQIQIGPAKKRTGTMLLAGEVRLAAVLNQTGNC